MPIASVAGKIVRDLMTTEAVTIGPGELIRDALNLMVENRVWALPVVDREGHCLGILSTSDLIDMTRDVDDLLHTAGDSPVDNLWTVRMARANSGEERVDSIMSEVLAVVHPDDWVQKAAQLMLRHRIHHLPVVDRDNRLQGILSTFDLLEALAGTSAK